jgi:hypothetical protein
MAAEDGTYWIVKNSLNGGISPMQEANNFGLKQCPTGWVVPNSNP